MLRARFIALGLIISATVSCASYGSVGEASGKVWKAAIASKNWNALPNPLKPYEAGDVLYLIQDGSAVTSTKVNACQGMLDTAGYTSGKEAWGKLIQNSAFEFGIFAGLEEGALPSGGKAEIKAGNRTVKNYTADFGEVSTKKVDAALFEIPAFVSDDCNNALAAAEAQGLLDQVYIVAGSVKADQINYSFNLNPLVKVNEIIKDSEVPDPGSPDVRQYEEKCGTYFKAAGKLLKFFGLAINGANCVSGSNTIKTSEPYYIAHITYPASALRQSGASSGGFILDRTNSVKMLEAADADAVNELLAN